MSFIDNLSKNQIVIYFTIGIVTVAALSIVVTSAMVSNNNADNGNGVGNNTNEVIQNTGNGNGGQEYAFERDLYQVHESDMNNHSENLNIDTELTLSAAEIEDLLFMREEEKLAHDVYTTLYEKWGQSIFDNISNSEQKHTDSIASLIAAYNLEDPYLEGIGNYTNEAFTTLYNDLVAQGSESIESALKVGALIEDLDIMDLYKAMDNTQNEAILTVYSNLQKGSRNHLRSFTDTLNRYGETYTPSYLSAEEYESIITSAHERGNSGDGGQRMGGNGRNR